MKAISKDISLTLVIKLLLLFILWHVCFKGMRRPVNDVSEWLLSTKSTVQTSSNHALPMAFKQSNVNPSKEGDL